MKRTILFLMVMCMHCLCATGQNSSVQDKLKRSNGKLMKNLAYGKIEGCEDCPEVKPIGFSVPNGVIMTKVQ